MTYAPIERNAKHVDRIAKAMQRSDSLLLATDPDREGEAISWHLYEFLKEKIKFTLKENEFIKRRKNIETVLFSAENVPGI
jgi:DNA topoisomerase-1